MARKRLRMYDYQQIIEGLRRGESERQLARDGVASRNTLQAVRRMAESLGWLDVSLEPPSPEQVLAVFVKEPVVPHNPSRLEEHRERVERWYRQGFKPKQIHRKLVDLKRTDPKAPPFRGSLGGVKRMIARVAASAPEVFAVMTYEPGEAAQVDFGSGPKLPDPVTGKLRPTHVFVMTMCHSRHMYVELVWDQKVETWLRCHQNAFQHFGGVPGKVIIDNLKAAITKACRHDPVVQRSYADFAKAWGFKIDPNPPRTPRLKGRVESGVKYVKGAVLCRDFATFVETQSALEEFVMGEAGNRIHGTTQQRPLTAFIEEELPALQPIPNPVPDMSYWAKLQVHTTTHVYHKQAFYSVPHRFVREYVWLKAGLKLVELYDLENRPIAIHPVATRRGQFRTNADHYPPDKRDAMAFNGEACIKLAADIGEQVKRFVDILLSDRVLERLGAARGVLALKSKYGPKRLNAACERALEHDLISCSGVKRILEKGLDQSPPRPGHAQLPEFESTRFNRNIGELLREAM